MATVSQELGKSLNTRIDEGFEGKSEYYASDIFTELGYKTKEEFESTLAKAFELLASTVSIKQNFKQVFKFDSGKMYSDWKISPLAYNFLKLNKSSLTTDLGKQ